MAGNISVINGQLYTVNNAMTGLTGTFGMPTYPTSGNIKPDYLQYMIRNKWVSPYQMPQQPAAQPANQGAGTGNMSGKLPDMYNRLTMQASDALYGGILGYQPKPITSPTGNQYQPPTNQGFQFPFGLLNRNFLGS